MIKRIMTEKKLAANVEARQSIKLQIEALKAELESIEDGIKEHFEAVGVDTIIVGNRKVTYKPKSRTTADSKRLKIELPEIFAEYSKTTTFKELLVR